MMKKFLVPLDGSPTAAKAAAQAFALAALYDAEVTLLRIVPMTLDRHHDSDGLGVRQLLAEYDKLVGQPDSEEATYLQNIARQYAADGVPTQQVILAGIPSDRITTYALEHNIDLIIIGRRGLNPLKRIFVGSVTQRVLADAPCHVLVVK